MVEAIQQESPEDPASVAAKADAALGDIAKGGGPGAAAAATATGKGPDAFIDGMMASPVAAISLAIAVTDAYNGGSGGMKGVNGSQFVGGQRNIGSGPAQTARRPLVPNPSYSEMNDAARAAAKANNKKPGAAATPGDVFKAGIVDRATGASASLTGSATTDPKGAAGRPIQGVKTTPDAVKALMIVADIIKKRDAAWKLTQGNSAYVNSGQLLRNDLAKGSPGAETAVNQSPRLAKKAYGGPNASA